ncbi:MAG: hypothetical protein GF331_18800, partial [Chitinivibrionales bacterium]|nr:hypothetical protein [Chitinivibrionales bacterium]
MIPVHRLRIAAGSALLATCLLTSSVAAGWNLPYTQPSTYDYSALYSQTVLDYTAIIPDFFEEELAKGWQYYTSTYIMSNGLVNHQRLDDGGSTVGQNEAVSEGQGYGMLLALLNNDQPTFNRIFEAANQHMWNSSTKTYFIWNWPAGSQGAATDADLDIGLALVFADKLQENGYWQPYNAGGVTYHSRAMDIIRSIRSRMTQDDYLLPGDNWGGSGINNLNPSYFATAWLKVFNDYQSEVDFTPVIDKCYSVISKMPRYSDGLAVDWCNTNGGRSQNGLPYGMGPDAIRVPWRIAMDALWFGDPRALSYCYNSRNTLTQYTNSNKGYLIAQMGLYDESGSVITDSYTCGEVAMWACAILGSRDAAYCTEALHSKVFSHIVGSNADYFGSYQLQDHVFYYKQSLAMLGFAALSGQFPNVLADMENTPPPEPIVLTSPLTVSPTSVALPATVTLSAAFDRSTSWTITLTGRTSNKMQTLTGSGSTVDATWAGSGWYTVETVDAVMTAQNLDPATAADQLQAPIVITSVPDRPVVEPGSSLLMHDCEDGTAQTPWGGEWYLYYDELDNAGASTVSPSDARQLVADGAGNPGWGARATFTVDVYAGMGVSIGGTTETFDLSNFVSFTFDYRTEGNITGINVALGTANISNGGYSQKQIAPSGSWKTETVRIDELQPPTWSPSTTKDITVSQKIQWGIVEGSNGTLYVDNITLDLKPGMLPGDDIMALINGSQSVRVSRRIGDAAHPSVILSAGVLRFDRPLVPGTTVELFDVGGRLRFATVIGAGGQCAALNACSVPLAGGPVVVRLVAPSVGIVKGRTVT